MSIPLDRVTAVILAGGLGTRVQHLLPGLPKPMAPVAGRPFLEWVVRYLAGQGVGRIVISTGHFAEVVSRHFESHPVEGVAISCIAESEPLGTAGGFLNAVRSTAASEAWLVMNGDSLVFVDLRAALAVLNEPGTAGAIVGCQITDTSRYGRLVSDTSGRLLRFEEKRPGSGVINSGVYLLRNGLVKEFRRQRR